MNPNSSLYSALLVSGRFFFRVRNALFPLVLLLVVVLARPAELFGSPALDQFGTALGILLVLAGEAFRMIVIGYAYIRRGGKKREVFANELVTRGFYAHTRNPMYVGNLMAVTGFALVFGSITVIALIVPLFTWIYFAITTAEETYLRGKFGTAFEDYARRVNRFIPNFRGLKTTLAEFEYDWRRALVKELSTLCVTLAILLGLLSWKIVHLYGYTEHATAVRLLSGALIPLALFYLTVRYLKKTRRLQPARAVETEQDRSAA
ncbi:MAG: S-isoprenylcysteine methyltransferase-like protein [Proteobacteria bacterium]|nr:S-isoprenylcysteine methyltransferase-like protein [Pseudomonadota bacterium]